MAALSTMLKAVVLLAGAAVATAQDSPDVVAQRMEDRIFFVERIGHGAEPMFDDLATYLPRSGTEGPERLRVVRDRLKAVLLQRYAGDEDRSIALLTELAEEAVDLGVRSRSSDQAVDLHLRRCDRFAAEGKDELALESAAFAQRLQPNVGRVYLPIAKLAVSKSTTLEKRGEYQEALALLDSWDERFPSEGQAKVAADEARKLLTASRDAIRASTGLLRVEWLVPASGGTVAGPKKDLKAGELVLVPKEGQVAPPARRIEKGKDLRARKGRYGVTIRLAPGDEYDAGPVEVPGGDRPADAFLLPSIAPANMVVVPSVDGKAPFLIDRYEVTVGEFRGGLGSGGDRRAMAGVTFDEATAKAKEFGKQLPTEDQWKTAAFYDPATRRATRKYPWGADPPALGKHFIGGKEIEGPAEVGGQASLDTSALGCRDLAGNVWEWVREAHFLDGTVTGEGCIGGSFAGDRLDFDASRSGVKLIFDKLRDAKPSERFFMRQAARDLKDKRTPAAQEFDKRYDEYRETLDEATKHDPTIGFRCIIELRRE